MATKFNYSEELGLLRHAVAEPVRQLIAVEFDTLATIDEALRELLALDPARAYLRLDYDFRTDTAIGLIALAKEKLQATSGSRPALLALVSSAKIEEDEGAPASERFWKQMNLAREAWGILDAQILFCAETWNFRQARTHADHLLSWAAMKLHLVGAVERPTQIEQRRLSSGLFGDYRLSPDLARQRWHELDGNMKQAVADRKPTSGFLQRFFIPMLEAALVAGDLNLARTTRDAAHQHGDFPEPQMPRWHELNLALALAAHEPDLANEHAYKLLALAETPSDERILARAAAALNNQATLLTETAHFSLAEPLFRKSLQLAEKRDGREHPNVAVSLNNLAQLLKATNRMGEAEPLMRQALAIDEQSFGKDHPNVAIRLNNLAQLLQETNRLGEAEPLMRRALAMDEQSFGKDHPTVARDLSNLASLLQTTNRLDEAEPLMRQALAIDEQSFGKDHPNVAIRLNNLAQLLQATNRLGEAEPLMRRALAIDEQSFGKDHPEVATDLNNLATLLQETNRLGEAEPLMRRALAIDEQSFGKNHPEVARDLNNLASLLQETNRLGEAEPLMRRALAIDERSFDPKHPKVTTIRRNLSHLLSEMNAQTRHLKPATPSTR